MLAAAGGDENEQGFVIYPMISTENCWDSGIKAVFISTSQVCAVALKTELIY